MSDVVLRIVIVAVSLLVVAFLVGRFAPNRRRRLRAALVLFLLQATVNGIGLLLVWRGGAGEWASSTALVGNLLQAFTAVSLIGIFVFDILLPLLRITIVDIVGDLLVGGAYVLATMGVLRHAGVNVSNIVTTSAVLTAVIGLSMQATLGNVVGGIALQLDGSVMVGDWIQLENGRQGRVAQIRWRHTVVETRDYGTIIVPNAQLLSQSILILGRRNGKSVPHRMWVYFTVDFRFSPAEVVRVVDEGLLSAPIEGVAHEPRINCICMDLAKQGIESVGYYAVRYWLTDLARDDPTSSAVRIRVYSALKRAGIPLALPGTAVFLETNDEQRAEKKLEKEYDRRLAALDTVELFSPMSRDEKLELAEKIRPAPFSKGEVITRQGAVAHWFYVLVRGEVAIRIRPAGGEEKEIARSVAPSFFGEMGVMTGAARTATVVALSEVECYRIEKEDFHKIIQARPEIADQIAEMLALRQVEQQALRENLGMDERQSRIPAESLRILAGIRSFFGLDTRPRS